VPGRAGAGWVARLVGDCTGLPDVELVALLRDGVALPEADWADRLDGLVFDRGSSPLRLVLLTPAGAAEWSGADANAAGWLAGQGCDVLLDLRLSPFALAPAPTTGR
jgi:hypothetical protein